MKPNSWPFVPVHITNDGEDQEERSQLHKLTGIGIINNEYLQGIQTEICANVENPTTLIEFTSDGEPVRTDSSLLAHQLRPPCKVFRECTKDVYCLQSDRCHAMKVQGLTRRDLETALELGSLAAPSDDPNCIKTDPVVRQDDLTKRIYVEYDCPLLGYRELLFPVLFNEKVIAALFVGQLGLQDQLDEIINRRKRYLQQNPFTKEFNIYKKDKNIPAQTLEDLVGAKHAEWFGDPKHVVDQQAYKSLITKCCQQIKRLETIMGEQMQIQRQQYIDSHIKQRIDEFYQQLSEGRLNKEDEEPLAILWRVLEQQLAGIVTDFNYEFALTFGIGANGHNEHTPAEMKVVAKAGSIPNGILAVVPTLVYSHVRDQKVASPIAVTDLAIKPSNIIGWPDSEFSGPSSSYDLSSPVQAQQSAVVLIIDKEAHNHAEEDRDLSSSLQSFFLLVSSSLSSILAEKAQLQTEAALRIFGHEMAQLTAGLMWLSKIYLKRAARLRDLSVDKANDICRDIEGFIQQIDFLTSMARWIRAVPQPVKQHFLAYRELLLKWKDIYRLDANGKKIQFAVDYPSSDDPLRPPLWGDQSQLEQLVYNLVNNAMKYCYRGTKVHMDCRKHVANRSSPHYLTIIDYGAPIDGGKELYELYKRGRNVGGSQGLGIGLYVAKKIVEAHGGSISHSSEQISAFNVPLIEAYLQSDKTSSDIEPQLRSTLEQLKASGEYTKIVAIGESGALRYSEPTIDELRNAITMPTYRVTLTVVIPAKEVE
jgi:signal transduction histidine kinase